MDEPPADVSRLDLRVGLITKAWRHPDAERCTLHHPLDAACLRGCVGAAGIYGGCKETCLLSVFGMLRSLYVEEIDVGEATGPRQVVSGLVKYIPEAAQLEGRRVVLVTNMKPANMRGVKSHAMVLAATSPDGATVSS